MVRVARRHRHRLYYRKKRRLVDSTPRRKRACGIQLVAAPPVPEDRISVEMLRTRLRHPDLRVAAAAARELADLDPEKAADLAEDALDCAGRAVDASRGVAVQRALVVKRKRFFLRKTAIDERALCADIVACVARVAAAGRVAPRAVECAVRGAHLAPLACAEVLAARFARHPRDVTQTRIALGWPPQPTAQWKIRDADKKWLDLLATCDGAEAKLALRACAVFGPPAVPEFLESRGLELRDLLEDDAFDDDDSLSSADLSSADYDDHQVYAGLAWDAMAKYMVYPFEDNIGAEGDCCICLSSLVLPHVRYRLGKPVRLDCACTKFAFHEVCLRRHLATSATCPVCRSRPCPVKP